MGRLLTGVLQGQEECFGGGAACLRQRIEQGNRFFCFHFAVFRKPLFGNRTFLLEIGHCEMDHFVQGRCQSTLGGRYWSTSTERRLEQARVEHYLAGPADCFRSQAHS